MTNVVVPPTVKPGSLDGSYAGAITLNVGKLDLGYGTPTINVPFAVVPSRSWWEFEVA